MRNTAATARHIFCLLAQTFSPDRRLKKLGARYYRPGHCTGRHFVFLSLDNDLAAAGVPLGVRLLACSDVKAKNDDLIIAMTPRGIMLRFYKQSHGMVRLETHSSLPAAIFAENEVVIMGVIIAQL